MWQLLYLRLLKLVQCNHGSQTTFSFKNERKIYTVPHFWNNNNNFYKVFCVQMLIMNDLIWNTLNDDSSILTTWLWRHLHNVFENNALLWIMDVWNQIYGLINWLDC